MKKISKILLSSVVSIALSLSLIVGGTFALFTSQSGTNVAITSGTVKVTATATLNKLESAKADPIGTLVDENGEKYSYEEVTGTFTNGGTAELSGNVLTLTNVTPGDKATISLAATNESNVNVKYRYTVNVTGDLAEYLTITLNDNEYEGLQTYESAWTSVAPAAAIDGATLAVALPMDAAAEAMGKTADVAFTVNAVQGNAAVSGQENVVCATKTIASVMPVTGEATTVGANVESDTAKVGDTKVVVPADKAANPAKPVTLSVEDSTYEGNFTIGVNETATPVEIKLDNVAEGTPVEVSVFVGKGYAAGSVKIYHKDDPVTLTYDAATGIATFTVTSFSPFTLVLPTTDYYVRSVEDLKTAIANATPDNKVVLMKDLTVNEEIELGADVDMTLDLNGHDIAFEHKKNFNVKGAAKFTIIGNGKVYEKAPYYAPIMINNQAADQAEITIGEGVTLEGWAGIFVNATKDTTNILNAKIVINGKLNSVLDIDGGAGFGIYVNGSISAESKVYITVGNTAVINSKGTGIYAAGPATWTIEDGAYIEGVESGIELRAGTLTINGGTIVATADNVYVAANGNGTTTVGSGLAIAQHTTKLNITVTVNGGTIKGYNGMTVANPQNNGEGEGTVTVTVAKEANLVSTDANGKDWSNTDTRESTTVTVEE